MKKLLILTIAAAMVLLMPAFASAQTANGTLTVTANVNSSIQLVFQKDAAGAVIGGANTNAATLAFGAVSAFGAAPAGVTETTAANSFTLSTPVDVVVTLANSASANYKLTAQLQAPSSNGQTFTVNALSVVSTSAQTINATAAYGATVATVAETIPFTVPNGTTLTDVINFAATAN